MRRVVLWAAASVLFVACQENEVMERNRRPINDLTFSTSWEETSAQGDTRTYINEKNQLRWNADDRISVFTTTTENRPYRFNGETGDNSGTFSPVENATGTGGSLKKNYAVYPYREENAISSDGSMTVVLPATQHYAENSFGLEANTMTAVTRDAYDTFLPFKNVGGYLKICLYGEDVTVKSITLRGNNGEKLTGKATIKLDAKGLPSVTMSDEATSAITLDCGDGVSIGTTEETATAFWIVLPPTKFEKGFTITVTDTDGGIALQTKDTEFEVTRNIIKPMEPMFLIIRASDDSLKSRLIEFYKSTGGDHWINKRNWCSDEPLSEWYGVTLDSIDQQLSAIKLDLPNNNLVGKADLSDLTSKKDIRIDLNFTGNALKSLDVSENEGLLLLNCSENQLGHLNISDCPKLAQLYCNDNQLKNLDVSSCPKLIEIKCANNQLTTLDVSHCSELSWLWCDSNQLTNLNISSCLNLEDLSCFANQLTSLDISSCPELRFLTCGINQLTSLDISSCPKLWNLSCSLNQLTTLDISSCPELKYCECPHNQLNNLYISANDSLDALDCENNQLITLDVSNCPNLFRLSCHDNQLTNINLSNCSKINILDCYNNHLTNLDISSCLNLESLWCADNQLRSLNVSNNGSLVALNCVNNQLTTLDVSTCLKLTRLYCSNNQLTSLNIWPIFSSLDVLECESNKISCQIPAEYAHVWHQRERRGAYLYDRRYEYTESQVIDHGVGWWYLGEPEKGTHYPD
ncbi:MAG: hypothetical protein ACI37U_04525 [Bacteroides sp.]